MLTLFRSPIPGILQAGGSLPGEVARLLERIAERPERLAWVVPTGRRKRALVKDWLAVQAGDEAVRLGEDKCTHRAALTRHTILPTSSATNSPPRLSIATPTGRP